MYMGAKHIKQLCRARRLGRGVRARGIEVPVKRSGVRAKGIGVQVKKTGFDGMGFWRFQNCNIGIGAWDGISGLGGNCTNNTSRTQW
jgi:hypothetical protein